MSTKIIAGSFWLATTAAASYLRACAAGLPAGISSAGRTNAQQHALFVQRFTTDYAASAKFDQRSYQGQTWWRRPGWTNAATPGSAASRHEQGLSLDLPAAGPREWMHAHGAAFGWIGNLVAGEPWHFEYQASRDASTGSPTLVANPIPAPTVPGITVPDDPTIKEIIMAGTPTLVYAPKVGDSPATGLYYFDPADGTFVGIASPEERDIVQYVYEIAGVKVPVKSVGLKRRVDVIAAFAKRVRAQHGGK